MQQYRTKTTLQIDLAFPTLRPAWWKVLYSEVSKSTPNILLKHNQQNRRMYNSHSEISFHYDEKIHKIQNFSPTSLYNDAAPASDAETAIRLLDSRMRVKSQ
jgi:hypothetical protein